MKEALENISILYVFIALCVGTWNIVYWIVSGLFRISSKPKEKDVDTVIGFIETPLTSSEIFRTTNRITFHRDMVALRKYCLEHTSEHLIIENRIKEAKTLEDYLLKKEG